MSGPNNAKTRHQVIHEIYQAIPSGPSFVVICDSYLNGPEQLNLKQFCVDVYFNDENDDLFCMEFVADPERELSLDDAIKINAAHAEDRQST